MEDSIKSIKAHLYDRVVSPLSGAFILSWVVWNYKLIVIVFSSDALPEKFKFIEHFYSGSIAFFSIAIPLNTFVIGALLPFITAILYIYIYPLISLPIYQYSLDRQKKLKKAKQDYDGEILLSVNESLAIKNNLSKIKSSYESEIGDLNKTISDLNLEIDDLNNEKTILSSNSNKSFSSINYADIDLKVKNRISGLSNGELFVLSDVFGANGWESFSALEKETIENIFKFHVSAKIYEGIVFNGKNDVGLNTYQKNPNKFWVDFALNESATNVIKHLARLGVDAKSSLHGINEKISGNMFETEESLEKLCRAGYLSKAIGRVNVATTFSLTEKGKQYAIKNGYHI